ncbi:MAG TPA: class I SAM-dependent methyltransferase [Syntrophorhabdales bacterium]|nr:class I SAM-dependent methyltransferase [Syntrophorhabdales bacterium]
MTCTLCGSSEQIVRAVFGDATYAKCTCGVTLADPMPTQTELTNFYNNNYVKSMGCEEANPHFAEAYQPVYQSEKVLTFKDLRFPYEKGQGLRWLDVGCANGLFVGWIRQFGYEAVGVDVASEMIQEARSKGLDCHCCEADELGSAFDIVSLWDVIEHSLNPKQLLGRVTRAVKRGGSLLLQTPCTGIISDTFGGSWREYTYPNHLHLFSQESLFYLLKDHGFMIRNWVRFGSGNTSGTLPDDKKKVFDTIAKQLGIGDVIALWAVMG